MKRAQASVEYLMIYIWAILVISLLFVVLWQIGIFGSDATSSRVTGTNFQRPLEATLILDSACASGARCVQLELTNAEGRTMVFSSATAVVNDDPT